MDQKSGHVSNLGIRTSTVFDHVYNIGVFHFLFSLSLSTQELMLIKALHHYSRLELLRSSISVAVLFSCVSNIFFVRPSVSKKKKRVTQVSSLTKPQRSMKYTRTLITTTYMTKICMDPGAVHKLRLCLPQFLLDKIHSQSFLRLSYRITRQTTEALCYSTKKRDVLVGSYFQFCLAKITEIIKTIIKQNNKGWKVTQKSREQRGCNIFFPPVISR